MWHGNCKRGFPQIEKLPKANYKLRSEYAAGTIQKIIPEAISEIIPEPLPEILPDPIADDAVYLIRLGQMIWSIEKKTK